MARTPPSRMSSSRILRQLRDAARKGDRASLTLAVDQMRTLAFSPRYWEKYLGLLRNPLARLVDLLAIKQGDRIAHQKGWNTPGRARSRRSSAAPAAAKTPAPAGRRRPRPASSRRRAAFEQPSLFAWEDATAPARPPR